jgi:hypothetical protein
VERLLIGAQRQFLLRPAIEKFEDEPGQAPASELSQVLDDIAILEMTGHHALSVRRVDVVTEFQTPDCARKPGFDPRHTVVFLTVSVGKVAKVSALAGFRIGTHTGCCTMPPT